MAAFVASLIVISGAQAGIPVAIDANPEWAIEAGRWTERLKQWAETVKHYENQINAYKQELLSKTGIVLGKEKLRRLTIKAELWGPHKQRAPKFQ